MTIRWGILATGNIAHKLADAVVASETSELVAVGSRTQDAADAFAKEYGLAPDASHGSYDALLDDDKVDVIYVSTPHPMHAEWTIKALEAGKAVLCEKPMGVNHPEVMAMVETAAFHQRFLMEAFMYRTHPQTAKAVDLIRDGAIGEVRQMNMSFGFYSPFHPQSRLHANELAGGGIMDVGCYPVSLARLVAGEEPDAVSGFAQLSETGVDAWSSALLHFPAGAIARVSTAVSLGLDNAAEVFGSAGSIRIASPWMGSRADGSWSFELNRRGKREIIDGRTKPLYEHEVEAVAEAMDAGDLESPHMTWEDSLGNARVLDLWRREAGVLFDLEKPERCTTPVHGRPLAVRRRTIPQAEVPGVGKPVSRLVMGCDNQPDIRHASVMWDSYFEYGGNTFDTAHIYGGGRMEQLLGTWMRNRGIRDDVVVIGKGAHTPANFPDQVGPQLDVSLERLGTDHLDIYFLHRDNPDVPVAEWMDVLNAERSAGRIKAFGGSNWSLSRVQQANAYAVSKGLTPFAAVSNNFSLARMVDPVWPGCIAASDADWRAWLEAEQMALFPWSSQARGFFTDRFDAIGAASREAANDGFGNQPSDAELPALLVCRGQLRAAGEAVELASERDVETINIALAYVLSQPFPCFALIGPRILAETRSSLAALDVSIGEDERRWLNLEADSR